MSATSVFSQLRKTTGENSSLAWRWWRGGERDSGLWEKTKTDKGSTRFLKLIKDCCWGTHNKNVRQLFRVVRTSWIHPWAMGWVLKHLVPDFLLHISSVPVPWTQHPLYKASLKCYAPCITNPSPILDHYNYKYDFKYITVVTIE